MIPYIVIPLLLLGVFVGSINGNIHGDIMLLCTTLVVFWGVSEYGRRSAQNSSSRKKIVLLYYTLVFLTAVCYLLARFHTEHTQTFFYFKPPYYGIILMFGLIVIMLAEAKQKDGLRLCAPVLFVLLGGPAIFWFRSVLQGEVYFEIFGLTFYAHPLGGIGHLLLAVAPFFIKERSEQ